VSAEKPKTVLIVDDNKDAADTLAILVKHSGCEATVVYESEAAFQIAVALAPSTIFLDIGMPHVDGYVMATRFRSDARFDDTFLVALTAYTREEDRKRAELAGFDLHMAKPIEYADLTVVLERKRKRNSK
jgi:CheY-like chemotaxis protein